jgi:hypothetical protein
MRERRGAAPSGLRSTEERSDAERRDAMKMRRGAAPSGLRSTEERSDEERTKKDGALSAAERAREAA